MHTVNEYKRRKKWLKFIHVFVVFGILVILYWLIRGVIEEGIGIFGLLFLLVIAYFSLRLAVDWIRQNKQDLEKNANTWGKGGLAELVVYNDLLLMGEEYKLIPDFANEKGNIDFILIGREGVFVIEVKAKRGIISYKNNLLYCSGFEIKDRNYLQQAWAEANYLSKLLSNRFDKHYPVTGILEFPNATIDTRTITRPINDIWVGGRKFHENVVNKSQFSMEPKEVDMLYFYLSSLNKSKKKLKLTSSPSGFYN